MLGQTDANWEEGEDLIGKGKMPKGFNRVCREFYEWCPSGRTGCYRLIKVLRLSREEDVCEREPLDDGAPPWRDPLREIPF